MPTRPILSWWKQSGDHRVLTTPISSREGEIWWSLCSYHTYFLTITREWGLVIIVFLPHLFPHERVRSDDHWVLTTPISSREGEVWWSLSSYHTYFLTRGWGLVIIEFLTTPISSRSREGEVWWSLCSYHTYFLTRGWGLYMKLVFMFTMWNDLCTPYLPLEYGIWSSPPWGYSQGNCHWPR